MICYEIRGGTMSGDEVPPQQALNGGGGGGDPGGGFGDNQEDAATLKRPRWGRLKVVMM